MIKRIKKSSQDRKECLLSGFDILRICVDFVHRVNSFKSLNDIFGHFLINSCLIILWLFLITAYFCIDRVGLCIFGFLVGGILIEIVFRLIFFHLYKFNI